MSTNSAIEWTDHTFNPWWGCTKVSEGCRHCYAEGVARRFAGDIWGPGKSRRVFGDTHWAEPLRWQRRACEAGRPARVFCASMADVFDPDAPEAERERLWRLISQTPDLDWQILTKRPELTVDMVPTAWRKSGFPENIWIGTSIESEDVLNRLESLRNLKAVVRFLSLEPLLGPLPALPLDGIGWVIVGGESGSRARPMDPAWVLDIQRQCQDAEVPFFFKQWGGRNKKAAGRLLGGRTYSEFPEGRSLLEV